MTRRRFTERQALECAIQQGAIIPCYRCKTPFTVETVRTAEREHIHERALDGADTVANCAYSCRACHALITNGNGATTAGSSKNRIAKATQPKRIAKFVVNKLPPGEPRPPSAWGNRKLQSGRKLPPRGSCPMNRKRRA